MKINERGYWENDTAEGHGVDENLCDALIQFFKDERTKSTIDMGCGTGYYTRRLIANGIPTVGVDGNPNTPEISSGLCKAVDLSVEQNLGKFDWVLSLEVGEHIPVEFEKAFFNNLYNNSRYGVVLSWAVRNQAGDGHVNCLENWEVIDRMSGFVLDVEATDYLRTKCAEYPNTGWWFRNTLMVFRRM